MPLDIVHSACPHDCPSTCALEVERIDAHRIGRVRGAPDNSYTAGVVCAKVARYAERVHHPDRLTQPLRRVGDKGVGMAAFEPIGWDDALDKSKTVYVILVFLIGCQHGQNVRRKIVVVQSPNPDNSQNFIASY